MATRAHQAGPGRAGRPGRSNPGGSSGAWTRGSGLACEPEIYAMVDVGLALLCRVGLRNLLKECAAACPRQLLIPTASPRGSLFPN